MLRLPRDIEVDRANNLVNGITFPYELSLACSFFIRKPFPWLTTKNVSMLLLSRFSQKNIVLVSKWVIFYLTPLEVIQNLPINGPEKLITRLFLFHWILERKTWITIHFRTIHLLITIYKIFTLLSLLKIAHSRFPSPFIMLVTT